MQADVVYQIKDTIFWKQITTSILWLNNSLMLFIRSKIQFFESKSQRLVSGSKLLPGCLSDQRYNFLKANHNPYSRPLLWMTVVYQIKDTIFWKQITTQSMWIRLKFLLFIRSKIQFFESKSQLLNEVKKLEKCCLSDQRYNFLKANHNKDVEDARTIVVVYQIKDTIFWKQITT